MRDVVATWPSPDPGVKTFHAKIPAAAKTANATRPAIVRRRVDCASEMNAGRSPRSSMSCRRSGTGTSSSRWNRFERSGIVFLQHVPQTPSASAQVNAHGRRRRSDDLGDLAHGVAGVVAEDEDHALTLR